MVDQTNHNRGTDAGVTPDDHPDVDADSAPAEVVDQSIETTAVPDRIDGDVDLDAANHGITFPESPGQGAATSTADHAADELAAGAPTIDGAPTMLPSSGEATSEIIPPVNRSRQTTAEEQAPMEMRQVAGLTSGSVMPLDYGAFQFSESIEGASFTVRVVENDQVVVLPGTASAIVDDANVVEPTPLGLDGVLNVGSACFVVRPPRKPLSPLIKAQNIEAMLSGPGPIKVPEFEPGEPIPQPTDIVGLSDAPLLTGIDGKPLALSAAEWSFLAKVRASRSSMAERHRQLHPHPEELKSRLTRLEPGLWDRTASHTMFGRFSAAFANIPWEPRFDDPERIPDALHDPIFAMALLPWVPVTANLLFGPLGIVGSRTGAVACSRHAMLSLAALSAPGELEFSIVTAKANVDTWSWTSALPRSFFPTEDDSYTVVVADGIEYFDSAGLDHEKVMNNEMGLIVIAETVDELPSYCGTIMQIDTDGTCHVANHLGETVPGTPIGVTEAFAHDMATRIADVLSPL